LILGLQLSEAYVAKVGDVVKAARERGLLVITAGEGCLRFLPALTIGEEEIRDGLGILAQAMEEVF
jgi:acetylornithine aminotransferase